ncbi:hypothetical protein CERZMDRAFT_43690, partial [Cercospora zeae-maydis SCOH1-5]
WQGLRGFGHMWHDLYRMYLDGPGGWEKEFFGDERREDLRQHFRRVGEAEARLCLRGVGGLSLDWGGV